MLCSVILPTKSVTLHVCMDIKIVGQIMCINNGIYFSY